jgi:hypothetical protein
MITQQQNHQFPFYNGVYGRISFFPKEGDTESPAEGKEQMSLF